MLVLIFAVCSKRKAWILHFSLSMEGMEISTKFLGDYEDGRVEGDMTVVFPGGEQEMGFTMERSPDRGERAVRVEQTQNGGL